MEQVELVVVVVVHWVDDTGDDDDVQEGADEGEGENGSQLTKEVRVEETVGGVEYDGDDQDVERGRLEVDLGPTEHPEEDGGDHHPCDDQAAGLGDDDEDLPDDPAVMEKETDPDGRQKRDENSHGSVETFIFLKEQRLRGLTTSLPGVLHGVALDDVQQPRPLVSVGPARKTGTSVHLTRLSTCVTLYKSEI